MAERVPAIQEPRTPFPGVFWAGNTIEILERFAYYGIFIPFGIYMQQLGYSAGELGIVQSVFLAFSYAPQLLRHPCQLLSGAIPRRF